jgi:hypothetical protein
MTRELIVFLTEGMTAWMHAWSSLAVEPVKDSGQRAYPVLNVSDHKEVPFTGVKSELVNILAAVSLSKLRRNRI